MSDYRLVSVKTDRQNGNEARRLILEKTAIKSSAIEVKEVDEE